MTRNGGAADVIVAGGGIIGCAAAYELARSGARVRILERGAVGGQTSAGAAGMLSARSEESEDDNLNRAARESRELYARLAEEFKAGTGIDIQHESCGILRAAAGEESADGLRKKKSGGVWLDPPTLSRRAPALEGARWGGLFHPEDGQVSSGRATEAFHRAARAAGAAVTENTEVVGFLTTGRRVTGVRTSRGDFAAEHVVLAAGVWSDALTGPLGWALPLHPVRGQILLFEMKERLLPFPACLDGTPYYLVPKADGTLYAGTTAEDAGYDARVTERAVAEISSAVLRLAPRVGELPFRGAWAGLRPGTPDGWPAIGPIPGWKNAWVAAGHFRRGILLAPWTGRTLADMILGRPLSPSAARFSPGRFRSPDGRRR